MAIMRIRNKYELSFRELVSQTKNKGGLPKEIAVSVKEAKEIIDEMGASSGGKPDTSFRVSFPKDEYDFGLARLIWEGSLSPDDMLTVLNAWYQGQFVVLFDDIPLKIEREKVKPPTTEQSAIEHEKQWWQFWR